MSSVDTLHRRVFVGTVSNVLGLAVIVICSLALIPLILHRVGATDYGILILITSIASFVYLLDIGISAGLVSTLPSTSRCRGSSTSTGTRDGSFRRSSR